MHAPNKLDSSYVDGRSLSPGQPQLPRSGRSAIRDVAIHVVAALGRWWRARADRRQRLRAVARLETLSDRTLKDIGVNRSEIYWVATHGRDAPPTNVPGGGATGLAAESNVRRAAYDTAAIKERSRAA
jgi:uncharacterized protein YjiS (DUF1127 family)